MTSRQSNPFLFSWCGDDLTGSTDVLEVLAAAGVPSVLFLESPTPRRLAKFPRVRAYGLAGGSRTMSPAAMGRRLPPALRALKHGGAPVVHYKVCSTFDSSPRIGSIGRAIELARGIFPAAFVPVVVGMPGLGRYVAFGNLFARSGLDSEPYRLDRHPTMTKHPITPMDEADLRIHLGRQTRLQIQLFDLPRLASRDPEAELDRLNPQGILLYDTVSNEDLGVIGRLIGRQMAGGKTLFCVGSSGLTLALVRHWSEAGVIGPLPDSRAATPRASHEARNNKVLAISGSRSPVTERQIKVALAAGYRAITLSPARLAHPSAGREETREAVREAVNQLARGRNIIVHYGLDSAGASQCLSQPARETSPAELGSRLARRLGRLLAEILAETRRLAKALPRVVICGGDTSTHAARILGIEALEFIATMAPGSPLCRAHAPNRDTHHCEIVFKGGQVGRDTFFLDVAGGRASDGRSLNQT